MEKHIAVEITIRLLAILLGSVPSLIAAVTAIGIGKNAGLRLGNDYYYDPDSGRYVYDRNEIGIDDLSEDSERAAVQFRDNAYTATGVVIGVALLGIISQMAIIFIRILGTVLFIRLNDLLKTIFLIFDIVVCFVLAAGHYLGGVLLNTNSDDMRWYLAYTADFVNKDDPEKIRNAITASSAFSSYATFLFIILAIFLIFFFFKDGNKRETVASAPLVEEAKLTQSEHL